MLATVADDRSDPEAILTERLQAELRGVMKQAVDLESVRVVLMRVCALFILQKGIALIIAYPTVNIVITTSLHTQSSTDNYCMRSFGRRWSTLPK